MRDMKDILEEVNTRIAAAAAKSGRSAADVEIVAVTKTHGPDVVREAWDAGLRIVGENKVQEAAWKRPLAVGGPDWHLIGHLQKNKVRPALELFSCLHSVDSVSLIERLQRVAEEIGARPSILLEVNIGAEESKSGFTPDETLQIAAKMGDYPGVSLRGLMAIPPISVEKGDNLRYFQQMHQLFIDISQKKYDNVSMVCLSMGMSDDFEDAIACGSTMIRIGTAIFGPRNYNK